MKIDFKLTEEFSRWAFEVQILKLPNWHIAFRNPTAGPWKRIESMNSEGRMGEVYRFDIQEKRPDIIIVNDDLKTIVIFEAKDTLPKLLRKSQVYKSAKVVVDMANLLSKINSTYWGHRNKYRIINGLLWGSEEQSHKDKINEAFMMYSDAFHRIDPAFEVKNQIGVESQKIKNKINLNYYKSHNSNFQKKLVRSFS